MKSKLKKSQKIELEDDPDVKIPTKEEFLNQKVKNLTIQCIAYKSGFLRIKKTNYDIQISAPQFAFKVSRNKQDFKQLSLALKSKHSTIEWLSFSKWHKSRQRWISYFNSLIDQIFIECGKSQQIKRSLFEILWSFFWIKGKVLNKTRQKHNKSVIGEQLLMSQTLRIQSQPIENNRDQDYLFESNLQRRQTQRRSKRSLSCNQMDPRVMIHLIKKKKKQEEQRDLLSKQKIFTEEQLMSEDLKIDFRIQQLQEVLTIDSQEKLERIKSYKKDQVFEKVYLKFNSEMQWTIYYIRIEDQSIEIFDYENSEVSSKIFDLNQCEIYFKQNERMYYLEIENLQNQDTLLLTFKANFQRTTKQIDQWMPAFIKIKNQLRILMIQLLIAALGQSNNYLELDSDKYVECSEESVHSKTKKLWYNKYLDLDIKNKDFSIEELQDKLTISTIGKLQKIQQKQIPNFCEKIFAKFTDEENWNPYYIRFNNSYLLFYKNKYYEDYQILYDLFQCEINFRKSDIFYLEIGHFFDQNKLLLTIQRDVQIDYKQENWLNEIIVIKNLLRILMIQLKIASHKAENLQLKNSTFTPIGKVMIQFCGIQNLDIAHGEVSIIIESIPYKIRLKNSQCDRPEFNQVVFIPIINHFFSIKILVIHLKKKMLKKMLGGGKTSKIGELEINVPDIIAGLGNGQTLFKLNSPKYKDNPPVLKIRMKNYSNLISYWAKGCPQYIDGQYVGVEQFKIKQIQTQVRKMKYSFRRFQSVYSKFKLKLWDLKEIWYFKYPPFSFLCLFTFLWICWVWNSEFTVCYFILALIVFTVYQNPKVQEVVNPFMNTWFFDEKFLNCYYFEQEVNTTKIFKLKKRSSLQRLINPKSRSLKGKLQYLSKLQRIIYKLYVKFIDKASFFERLVNLHYWEDDQRTILYVGFLVAFLVFIYVITFRFFMMMVILLKFSSGYSKYKKLYKYNYELVSWTLDYIIKKQQPKYHYRYQERLTKNTNWQKDKVLRKQQDKFIKELKERLDIHLLDDFKLTNFQSPVKAVEFLSKCHAKIKYIPDLSPKHVIMPPFLQKTSIKKLNWRDVFYFIHNIPSQFYRLQNPNKYQVK